MAETPVKKRRLPMRKVIIGIVVVMAIAFIVFSITEIQEIWAAIKTGKIAFLLVALALELICLVNNSLNYRSLYRLVGLEESLRRIFLIATSSTFINIVTPSGGFGGMAVFIDNAKKRGQSYAKVMMVGILYMLYEYISLLLVVILGFIALIRRNDLNTSEIIAAAVLLVFIIFFTLVLYFGYRSPRLLGDLLFKVASWTNQRLHPIFHRDLIKAENAHVLAMDIAEGVEALTGKKTRLLTPLFFALSNKALLIGVLTFIFLSLEVPFSSGTIVAGYSIAQLFFYIMPTPAGIGFVEGIFPLTLNALLVPFAAAVLITLIYRGITLWLAFAIGFFSFQQLQREMRAAEPPALPPV